MIKAQALHQTWEAATHKILFSKEHLVISGWVVLCTKNQSFKQNSCLRCILKPHTDHLHKGEYVLEWVPCADSLASFPCHCSSWSDQNWVESWWPLWIRQAVLWVEVPLNLLRKVILVHRKIARNWYSQATQKNCCTHLCTSICNSPIFSPCKPEVGSIIFYHSKWKSRIAFFLSRFEGVFQNLIKSVAPSVLFFSPPTSQLNLWGATQKTSTMLKLLVQLVNPSLPLAYCFPQSWPHQFPIRHPQSSPFSPEIQRQMALIVTQCEGCWHPHCNTSTRSKVVVQQCTKILRPKKAWW